MAAPSVTPRQLPVGFKLPDGFKTLITFEHFPTIQLWERDVKPVGFDGGEPIDTTTMHNSVWRTAAARQLKTLMPVTFNSAYDPDVLPTIQGLINYEQSITVTFPDGSRMAFWGYLQKYEPADMKEGDFPMAGCTVVPTNWDPANHVEAGPVFSGAVGT